MKDELIVELYLSRSENAIRETDVKYGKYLFSIAYHILNDHEDSKEAVNDTYLGAWKSIPPHRPTVLSAFLGKIARRVSINKWRSAVRIKRGGGEIPLALDELEECIPANYSVESEVDAKELAELLNDFLSTLSDTELKIFMRRYWYMEPVSEISRQLGYGESKVKTTLHRTRKKLMLRLKR